MDASGWQTVARALATEIGAGITIEFAAIAGAAPSASREAGAILSVPDLGTWTVDLSGTSDGIDLAALRQSLALAKRLEEGLPLLRAELEAVLDPLPYAALLLDGEARLIFANAAGEDILASRRLFWPSRQGAPLRPARRWVNEALDGALARILDEHDPGLRWMARGPADTHLAIHMRPIGPARPARGAARILLTLRAIGTARGATG